MTSDVVTSSLRRSAAALAGFALAFAVTHGAGARNEGSPQSSAGGAHAPAAASSPAQGRGRGLQFTEPSPLDFDDHEGYVSIFDGKTLDGWDGNPKFWRVEGGAIVGESTPERPSGNNYIVYRRMEANSSHLTTFRLLAKYRL